MQTFTSSLPPVPLSRLDPILYKKCQGDAARLCYTQGWNETNEMTMPSGAVFSCLYRHAYRSVEQGRRVSRHIFLLSSIGCCCHLC